MAFTSFFLVFSSSLVFCYLNMGTNVGRGTRAHFSHYALYYSPQKEHIESERVKGGQEDEAQADRVR